MDTKRRRNAPFFFSSVLTVFVLFDKIIVEFYAVSHTFIKKDRNTVRRNIMDLNTLVSSKQGRLLACLQENLRIPSVEGCAEEGSPYGIHCRRSLDHVLEAAQAMGF